MNIDIESIKRLKDLTGVGLTDAKKALIESKGNFDEALSEMRKKGLTKAEKRAERETRAGVVGNYNHDNRIGVIVEINCETDFVAKNELFVNFVKDIAMHIAASNPIYLDQSEISAEIKDKLIDEYRQKAINENKPKDMIDKIAEAQFKKYSEENSLLTQAFIKNTDLSVKDLLNEFISRLGENIVIRKFYRIGLGELNN